MTKHFHMHPSQHGFLPHRSVTDAILTYTLLMEAPLKWNLFLDPLLKRMDNTRDPTRLRLKAPLTNYGL